MKSKATIQRHIRELRAFIDRPVSAGSALEHMVEKRIAYCVETVLRYEVCKTVGWRTPTNEVLEESAILVRDIRSLS